MKLDRYTAGTAVALAVIVALVALYALGASDAVERWVERTAAVLGPIVVAYLTKDTDGDGSPDAVDADPNDPEVH